MKFRGNKLVMSLAIMGVMSTTVTSFANTSTPEGDHKVEIKSEIQLPTVSLTLPTGEQKMTLDIYNESGKGQVQVPRLKIQNNSKLDVELALKNFEVVLEGDVKPTLATAPVTSTSTKKEIFLYLDAVNADADAGDKTDYEFTYDSKVDAKKVVKAGTTDLNQSYGLISGKGLDGNGEAGSKELRLYGNLNEKANWSKTDTVAVTPIFKATLVKHTDTTTSK